MSDEELTSRLDGLFEHVPEPEEVSLPAEGAHEGGPYRKEAEESAPAEGAHEGCPYRKEAEVSAGMEAEDGSDAPVLSTADLFSDPEEAVDEQPQDSSLPDASEVRGVYERTDEPVREDAVSLFPPPTRQLRSASGSQKSSVIAGALVRLWEPHAGPSGEARRRLEEGRAKILNILLGGAAVGGGLGILALIVSVVQKPERFFSYIPFLLAYALLLTVFLVRRIPMVWRTVALIGVSYIVALFSVYQNGVISTAPWYLLAIPLLFFILVGERAGIISAVVNVLLLILLAAATHWGWVRGQVAIDLRESVSQFMVVSVSFALVSGIVVVVQTLFARTQRQVRLALEEQSAVLQEAHATSAQRQQDLERANLVLRRQTQHFELSIQIGRVAAMGLEMAEFATQAAQLIQERMGAHYVGLFLLDQERTIAQLEAVAGMPWRALTPRQQRLVVADEMLLRQCVASGRARILLGIDHVQGLASREGYFLLPETQSALALPLIARGEVFGALTIQSRSPAGFKNEDMVSLRTVADQVATAISNSRLAQELQGRLQELEVMQRYYVRQAWDEFLSSSEGRWYEYHLPGVAALEDALLPEVEHVLREPHLTILSGSAVPESTAEGALCESKALCSEGGPYRKSAEVSTLSGAHSASANANRFAVLAAPISLREQVLGVLGFHQAEGDASWTQDQIELVEAITEQMGLIIENARLFADAQSRAARERRAREITARMREPLDVEGVLKTAVREMGEALQLRGLTIRLAEQQVYAAQDEAEGTNQQARSAKAKPFAVEEAGS